MRLAPSREADAYELFDAREATSTRAQISISLTARRSASEVAEAAEVFICGGAFHTA